MIVHYQKSPCQPPIVWYNLQMFLERGFTKYFAKSENGETYQLRVAVADENGKAFEALDSHQWAPKQAIDFAKYLKKNNVPTAAERLVYYDTAYIIKRTELR